MVKTDNPLFKSAVRHVLNKVVKQIVEFWILAKLQNSVRALKWYWEKS